MKYCHEKRWFALVAQLPCCNSSWAPENSFIKINPPLMDLEIPSESKNSMSSLGICMKIELSAFGHVPNTLQVCQISLQMWIGSPPQNKHWIFGEISNTLELCECSQKPLWDGWDHEEMNMSCMDFLSFTRWIKVEFQKGNWSKFNRFEPDNCLPWCKVSSIDRQGLGLHSYLSIVNLRAMLITKLWWRWWWWL